MRSAVAWEGPVDRQMLVLADTGTKFFLHIRISCLVECGIVFWEYLNREKQIVYWSTFIVMS